MARTASINFATVKSIGFAVSHSERTELAERKIGYLLPEEHRLKNIIVDGSLSEQEMKILFEQKKEGFSRQAKTAGASPFWEGVMVLPEVNGQDYSQRQAESLGRWKTAFQEQTRMRVLHMTVHLDEGYLDANGKPVYNAHAHIIIDRTDDKNKIIRLGRGELSKVQDLTAEAMGMQRGQSLADRQGRRGRQHLGHAEYRAAIERGREIELGQQRQAQPEQTTASRPAPTAQGIEETQAIYRELRGWLKGSGQAKQADYSELKKLHETGPGIEGLAGVMEQGGDVLAALRQQQIEREKRERIEREAAADREPLTDAERLAHGGPFGLPLGIKTHGDLRHWHAMMENNAKISGAVFKQNQQQATARQIEPPTPLVDTAEMVAKALLAGTIEERERAAQELTGQPAQQVQQSAPERPAEPAAKQDPPPRPTPPPKKGLLSRFKGMSR